VRRREICPNEHTELEKVLAYGMYGTPVVKKEERMHYLGQLRERVIFALTEDRVKRGEVPRELEKTLDDIRAARMIIKGNLGVKIILKYERLAKKHGVETSTVSNPQFKGNVGLVVVSNHAVDLPDSQVFPEKPVH